MAKEVKGKLQAIRLGQAAERQGRAKLAKIAPGATQSVVRAKLTGLDNNRN